MRSFATSVSGLRSSPDPVRAPAWEYVPMSRGRQALRRRIAEWLEWPVSSQPMSSMQQEVMGQYPRMKSITAFDGHSGSSRRQRTGSARKAPTSTKCKAGAVTPFAQLMMPVAESVLEIYSDRLQAAGEKGLVCFVGEGPGWSHLQPLNWPSMPSSAVAWNGFSWAISSGSAAGAVAAQRWASRGSPRCLVGLAGACWSGC
jgi:hypothetical protein